MTAKCPVKSFGAPFHGIMVWQMRFRAALIGKAGSFSHIFSEIYHNHTNIEFLELKLQLESELKFE